LRVAFLLQDLQLRAGVGAVVAHAAATPGAAIVLTREQEHRHWRYPGLDSVPVLSFASALAEEWDVAVASGGATAAALLDLRATRHACLLVEDDTVDGVSATALPLRFLAPTRAAAALIEDLQPGNSVLHVPTAPLATPIRSDAADRGQTPIRSGAATRGQTPRVFVVGELDRPTHDDVAAAVAASDVVLALDDAGDPYDTVLLAVALGVPVVATAVPGRDEAVVHGGNGLLVDDPLGAGDAVARATRLTPSPSPSSSVIAAALQRVLDEPPPPAHAVARRVAADLATAHADAEALRAQLSHAAAPPSPAVAPSPLRRVARAARRRLRR
jgi:glycosyltransferase involved in cell wall biosynthesis